MMNKLTTSLVIFTYVLTGWLAHGLHPVVHTHKSGQGVCAVTEATCTNAPSEIASVSQCCLHGHSHTYQSIADQRIHNQPVDPAPVEHEHQHDHDACQVCQMLFTAVTLSISFGCQLESFSIPAEQPVESIAVIVSKIKAYDTRGPPLI